jgi:hypothetical protein
MLMATADPRDPSSPPDAAPPASGLPTLRSTDSPAQILAALETAARRGRLPGYNPSAASFQIRDFGTPFECALVASFTSPDPGHTAISFAVKVRPLIPAIFAISLIVSIWPGIYLVDSMLQHYFSWYNIPTWWWYLPLTVPTSPWAFFSALKKSRASGHADAGALVAKVASELKAQQGVSSSAAVSSQASPG